MWVLRTPVPLRLPGFRGLLRLVRAEEIKEFANRDWSRVHRAKLDHWRQQYRGHGVGPALRAAGALRAYVFAFAAQDSGKRRRADLDDHVHVKRLIDAASIRFTG